MLFEPTFWTVSRDWLNTYCTGNYGLCHFTNEVMVEWPFLNHFWDVRDLQKFAFLMVQLHVFFVSLLAGGTPIYSSQTHMFTD